MPKKARKRSTTGIYHIMVRGVNRQNIFEDKEDHLKLLDIIKENKKKSGLEIYGYCLMGNHFHILTKEGKYSISIIMQKICSSYAYWFNLKYDRLGHLFQERFKSEVVEDQYYLLTVLRYIHQNPIKAGLIRSLHQWDWSSYNEYITEQTIVDKEFVLGLFSNNKYLAVKGFKSYMGEITEEKCLDYIEKHRMSDDELCSIIEKKYGVKRGLFHLLDTRTRDTILNKLKNEDYVTIRQLARVTGLNKYNIEKA